MTDLDSLFSSINWRLARRDGAISHYISESAADGFQPMVKIEDDDYTMAEIVMTIAYSCYLDGFRDGVKGAAKKFRQDIEEAGQLH